MEDLFRFADEFGPVKLPVFSSGGELGTVRVQLATVPEPTTLPLLLSGLAGLVLVGGRTAFGKRPCQNSK